MNTHHAHCTCGCCQDNDAQAPLSLANPPGHTRLNYRVGTHASFKTKMLRALSRDVVLGSLKSRADDDFGIGTIDAWATALDVLSFYQERIIHEGFLRTATERYSVLELARLIGYTLSPGVSAGTFLSFNMNEAIGAPPSAIIEVGTKVQSVPEQDQLPQIFETSERIEARREWNAIKPRLKRKIKPTEGQADVYLKGVRTGLKVGDGILILGGDRKEKKESEQWDFRRVKDVLANSDLDYTKIKLDRALYYIKSPGPEESFQVFALPQRAFAFGYNAPDPRSLSEDVRGKYSNSIKGNDWNLKVSEISGDPDSIRLDGLYPKVVPGSWVAITSGSNAEIYEVEKAKESSHVDFTLASKTKVLKLIGEQLGDFEDHVRDLVVFCQSEELEFAETADVPDLLGDTIALEKTIPTLAPDQWVMARGQFLRLRIITRASNLKLKSEDEKIQKDIHEDDLFTIVKAPIDMGNQRAIYFLQDDTGFVGKVSLYKTQRGLVAAMKEAPFISEVHQVEKCLTDEGTSVLTLKDPLVHYFDPATFSICANVAPSTHGEMKREILGSGDGSQVFQKFELKQNPLTFVSAATASGRKTTLKILVNDVQWKEVGSFFGVSARENVYTVRINNEGKVTIQFGDGITGARLPTGIGNVQANYRVGVGLGGKLNQDQLTMLLTAPLGVSKVTNPLSTQGAEDPERLEQARQNAPLTALTLDRIVSLKDFDDFSRAFAGIGKSHADLIWKEQDQIVVITVAAADKSSVDKTSDLYNNLLKAIKHSGHSYQEVRVESYEPVPFSVNARLQVNPAYSFERVKKSVSDTLVRTFSFESRSFGQSVTHAEVIVAIQKTDGIISVDLEQLNRKEPYDPGLGRVDCEVARIDPNNSAAFLGAQLLVLPENGITLTPLVV